MTDSQVAATAVGVKHGQVQDATCAICWSSADSEVFGMDAGAHQVQMGDDSDSGLHILHHQPAVLVWSLLLSALSTGFQIIGQRQTQTLTYSSA